MTKTRSKLRWILLVIALGIMAYGGFNWYATQPLSRSQMRVAVQQAYQADVTRMQQQKDTHWVPDSQWEQTQRDTERKKLEKQICHQAELGKSWFLAGLAMLILCFGNFFLVPWSMRLTKKND